MTTITRAALVLLTVTLFAPPVACAAELDRGAIDFTPPSEMAA